MTPGRRGRESTSNDWFEITTYSNDPTRIEMRRLSDEEAEQARKEQAMRLIEEILRLNPEWRDEVVMPLVDKFAQAVNEIADDLKADKAKERQRVKEDVRKKRREMFKKRRL